MFGSRTHAKVREPASALPFRWAMMRRPARQMRRFRRQRWRFMESKQRILVVDDEPQITLILRSGLVKHGYDVRVAAEGESALELFRAWMPHLVVTDLSMPNMGGLELCRRLRAVSNVPIIVLSVKGDERVKVEALDSGADDFVTKPFGMDELLGRERAEL